MSSSLSLIIRRSFYDPSLRNYPLQRSSSEQLSYSKSSMFFNFFVRVLFYSVNLLLFSAFLRRMTIYFFISSFSSRYFSLYLSDSSWYFWRSLAIFYFSILSCSTDIVNFSIYCLSSAEVWLVADLILMLSSFSRDRCLDTVCTSSSTFCFSLWRLDTSRVNCFVVANNFSF